jgi:hypothetical protein
MASSKCPSCKHSGFSLVMQTPTGSGYPVQFIQCSSCGTVVGVLDFKPAWPTLDILDAAAKELKSMIVSVGSGINQMATFLQRR